PPAPAAAPPCRWAGAGGHPFRRLDRRAAVRTPAPGLPAGPGRLGRPARRAAAGAPPGAGADGMIRGLSSHSSPRISMELNPVRQRIADLRERLDSLRGYL